MKKRLALALAACVALAACGGPNPPNRGIVVAKYYTPDEVQWLPVLIPSYCGTNCTTYTSIIVPWDVPASWNVVLRDCWTTKHRQRCDTGTRQVAPSTYGRVVVGRYIDLRHKTVTVHRRQLGS